MKQEIKRKSNILLIFSAIYLFITVGMFHFIELEMNKVSINSSNNNELVYLTNGHTLDDVIALNDENNNSVRPDELYLTDLNYITNMSYTRYDKIRYNEVNGGAKITLKVENGVFTFDNGIWAHAESQVTYDIGDLGYRFFTTFVGLNTTSSSGDGVKFRIYTSTDGNTWEPRTDEIWKKPGENATLIKLEIGDAKYLRLFADDISGNGHDHAVYGEPKLVKSLDDSSSFKSVEEYDEIIKNNYANQEDITGEYEFILLKRELVKNVGQFTLNRFYNSSTENKNTIDWLMNNQDVLRYYILGGKPDGGSYYNSLTVLSQLYNATYEDIRVDEDGKYVYTQDNPNKILKNDFLNTELTNNKWYPELTKGDVYTKMAISLSLTHSTAVGYWAQINHPSNRSDALERYRIFKYLYDNGKFVVSSRQDHTIWFEALNVEEMRYIMNSIVDNEEIIWFNEYTQTRIDAHPNQEEKYLQPHTYIAYVWPNFANPIYHDPENYEYFDNLFDGIFSKYGVTYSSEGNMVYKAWMSMRNKWGTGAVCGGISKLGTHIRAAHGTPASVISQPGHAAIIYYRKNADGKAYWTIDNDVSGWAQSGKTERLSIRMPLGWGNDSYVSGWAATYIVLAQEAMNDWDNYEKSEKLIMLADVYKDDLAKKEEILKKAIDTQEINIDAWWELIQLYNSSERAEEDYYNLATEMGDALLPFPLPLYNLFAQLKGKFTSTEYSFKFTLLQTKILNDEKNYTATDRVIQPSITRTVGNFLLGQTDTDLATFSFDGEDAGKIVLSSSYDGNGIRWDYSLDGKNSWTEVSFSGEEEHKLQLTEDELNSITSENDIYVHIVGVDYSEDNIYKIDILESTGLPATLYANDNENKLFDAVSTIEWKYNEEDEWTKYGEEQPDLTGNKTLIVRNGATGVHLASRDSVTYTFTEENYPNTAKYIPIEHLSVHEYTSQSQDSGRPYYAPNAIDGNMKTLWHTDFKIDVRNSGQYPFYTVKLDEPRNISAIEFTQIQYKANNPDYIKDARFYVSVDGNTWIEAGRIEGLPQKNELRRVNFEQPVYGQYLKVEMVTHSMFTSLAMLNLYEDTTIKTIGTFSFDGEHENTIMIVDEFKNNTWEYSLDGGNSWNNGHGVEHKLTKDQINQITEENGIKIRLRDIPVEDVIRFKKYDIPQIPAKVYLNDYENRLIGMTNTDNYEWKIDDGDWISYSEKEPIVKGNKKLYIRRKASGINLPSDGIEYQFTSQGEGDLSKTYITIDHLEVVDYSSETYRTGNDERAIYAIDGNANTYWLTNRTLFDYDRYITIKLDSPLYISMIQYQPYSSTASGAGRMIDGNIYVSLDGENWTLAKSVTGLANDDTMKDIVFDEPVNAQYIKIQATKSTDLPKYDRNIWMSAAMINVYEDATKRELEPPIAEVEYSETELTNKDVIATVTFDKENVDVKDGNTHTFTSNGSYTFEYVDEYGNEGTIEAIVDWIDKDVPEATIAYSISTKTNQDVIATIAFNEDDVVVTGGNIRTFAENGEYTFEFTDKAGNKGIAIAKVDWIDKDVPEATITYSTTNPTHQDVIATIIFDEENVVVSGGDTHTFTENGSYVFEYVDEAGNVGTATATVDWIDKTIPRATITYSITEPTNKDVVATITFDKENVTVKDGNTHIFAENGEYTFEFVGTNGHEGSVIAKVDWIDKIAPKATITYSTEHPTNQDVIATVTFDKENVVVSGGNTHTFYDNGKYVFEYVDKAGNTGTIEANVTWIDKSLPEATITYSTTELTNQDVIATVTFDEENIEVKNGNTYTFTKNGEYEFEYEDASGNKGTIIAKVDWIDKIVPEATITYSTTEITNQDVIATVTFDKENVVVSGGNTHTFYDNGKYVFEYVDEAGNTGEITAIVSWIRNVAPKVEVDYSTTEATNEEVIVTLTFEEEVTILNQDIYIEKYENNVYKMRVLDNIEFTVYFEDKLGNSGRQIIKVDWIDKTAPTAEVRYSETELTNEDVIVYLVNASEEIIITNNGGNLTHTFTENGEFTFEFMDTAGNEGSVIAKVDWIDKVAPTAEVEYSETELTNKDVTVTIKPSEEVTIINNDGKDTYVFTENGEFTFEFEDKAGNKGSVTVKVDWIDKVAPTAEVKYSTTELTNSDVIATLINESEEITIEGEGTYIFTENGEYIFNFVDKAGNKGSVSAKVDNIDKVVPTADVEYSETELTNKDVTVKLVNTSEEIAVTNNDGKDTYVFTENGEYTFEFVDKAGNKGSVTAKVDNIDKIAPTVELEYSETMLTNKDVIVTLINASEEIIITNNNGKNSYIFTENGTFTFEFEDKVGNKGSITAKVDYISKNMPTAEVEYSTTELTNGDVVVTLINESEHITITNNNGSREYTFTENGEFVFEFVNDVGIKGVAKAVVKNIDKIAPTATVEYSTLDITNKDVTVTINPSEEVTITNNDGSDKYVFTENGEYTFEFEDKAGNIGTVKVKVGNIDKVAPTADVEYSTTELTNGDVTVTLVNASEEIEVEETSIYTFTENGEHIFNFVDKAGNRGSVTAKVDNIDKVVPTAKAEYSETELTNQNVTVEIKDFSEDVTILNNNGQSTLVFTENGEFTFEFKDRAGNIGTLKVSVSNIDKIAPTAKVEYSTTELTNQDVIATLVDASEEITITNNNGSRDYVFTENGEFTFEFVDKVGNKGTVVATVSNIDRTIPTAEIKYSETMITNKDVNVTLVNASEEITITNNNGSKEYVFIENGEFVFEFVNKAGVKGTAKAIVRNIDKVAPTAKVTYSNKELTNKDVVVTLTEVSEEIVITNNDGKDTYTFTENGEFIFEFTDKAGNIGTVTAKVDNIDKIVPTAKVEYSTTDETDRDVIVTLVDASEDIIITNNEGSREYVFTENGTFVFEYVDKAGNEGTTEVEVTWIVKGELPFEVKFDDKEETDKPVTVTLELTEGTIITNNEGKNTYTFIENGEFTFEYVDRFGNNGTYVVKVDWIKKEEPENPEPDKPEEPEQPENPETPDKKEDKNEEVENPGEISDINNEIDNSSKDENEGKDTSVVDSKVDDNPDTDEDSTKEDNNDTDKVDNKVEEDKEEKETIEHKSYLMIIVTVASIVGIAALYLLLADKKSSEESDK